MKPGQDRLHRIGEVVRQAYEEPATVARYVDIGLWPAEEILILDFLEDGERVLDVGCGAGRTSIPLAEQGFEVVGIDLSARMVEVARQQAELVGVSAQFERMDVTRLDFDTDSFDAALFSYNGFELVPGLAGKRRALGEVHRVLRPGGTFIFCTHSMFALNSFAPYRLAAFLRFCGHRFLGIPTREHELGERFADDPGEEVKYLQVLPPFYVQRLLREAGFSVVLYNTRARVEQSRAWHWTAGCADGERFYVARKD